MTVIETVQYRTPLAVRFHDLVTDAAIAEGLVVSARRAGARAGRFRAGRTTPSGVHVLAGLPFLRALETPHPAPGQREDLVDLPSAETVDVDVLVEDRRGRFLPTVLLLTAPLDRIATAADALAAAPDLVWSFPADTPMFLLSTPTRALARTTAVVRASLRHHDTGVPAAHAVLVVETPGGRAVGVADSGGNVMVAFPYPDFATSGTPGSFPAGSHGIPTADQQWPVTVSVRWQPSSLVSPSGVDVPYAHTVFDQDPALVFDDDAAAGQPSLSETLPYGVDLGLATTGAVDRDRASYLFVEPAP